MSPNIQNVFRRYEKKYLLTSRQYQQLRQALKGHMKEDAYGAYTVCNIYFDTDDFSFIRNSIEKPVYKEKLRLRSYGIPQRRDRVFAEIKKKYKGVVYKRRVCLNPQEAQDYLLGGRRPAAAEGSAPQILNEIDWFLQRCHPSPKVFIGYDRLALSDVRGGELRVTFDQNIRWRQSQLDLRLGDWGSPLLAGDIILMEIKIPEAAPLWLSHLLNEEKIYPTSFSKYGTCYKEHLCSQFFQTGVNICA